MVTNDRVTRVISRAWKNRAALRQDIEAAKKLVKEADYLIEQSRKLAQAGDR